MFDAFRSLISNSFASDEALKTELLTTAASMFGSGWVWLVLDQYNCLRILCTYNAGTPYTEAYRRQNKDVNTSQTLGSTTNDTNEVTRLAFRKSTNNWITPLLNINVWEHAWLEDFGVNGKEEYLTCLWKAIDWNAVYKRSRPQEGSIRPLMNK